MSAPRNKSFGPESGPKAECGQNSESASGDSVSKPRWLEATDNPFGIRVLDCRPVVLVMVSTTTDPNIARSFVELRSSSGAQHIGRAPENATLLKCDLSYRAAEDMADGSIFVAEKMEDKWDIYLFSGHLYFARSWTGRLEGRARISLGEASNHVDMIEVRGEIAKDEALAIAHIDYLIKSHLYNKVAPHPIPRNMPVAEDKIALYSFASYGRRGQFASYEDTTSVNVF